MRRKPYRQMAAMTSIQLGSRESEIRNASTLNSNQLNNSNMESELTREQLLDLKMGELRELYPDIKDNKKSDFVDKVMEQRAANAGSVEIIVEESPVVVEDAVTEGFYEVVEEDEEEDDDEEMDALKLILENCCKPVKILIIAESCSKKDELYSELATALIEHMESKEKSIMTNKGSNEIHLDGKTFVKVSCPLRYPVAIKNRRYDIELEV